MGHELVHVSQYAALAGRSYDFSKTLIEIMEFHAYSFEYSLGSGNAGGFSVSIARELMTQFPSYFNSLNYLNFSWTSRANYLYPF